MSQLSHPYDIRPTRPHYSIPSLLAIACAVASLFFGAGIGFALALAAIILGAVGFLLALAPNIRGGFVSILAVLGGVLGVVLAIIKLVMHVVVR